MRAARTVGNVDFVSVIDGRIAVASDVGTDVESPVSGKIGDRQIHPVTRMGIGGVSENDLRTGIDIQVREVG